MATELLSASSPEYRWINRTIKAVEKRLGRGTGWNGLVLRDPDHQGRDQFRDGTLVVRDDTVLAPLRAVSADGPPTVDQADQAAATVSIIAREAAAAAADRAEPATQADIELLYGMAETWAHYLRSDLVSDIGLTEKAPGLADRTARQPQIQFLATHAAHGLVLELADRSKGDRIGIMERVLTAPGERRWQAIADVALDLRAAGAQREAALVDLAEGGRDEFAGLPDIFSAADKTSEQRVNEAYALGTKVAGSLVRRMDDITPSSDEYRWAARVIHAVGRRTGLPTRWNGRIYPVDSPNTGGAIWPDNTMTLNDSFVFAPIRAAFTQQQPLTAAQAGEAVLAVHVVAHESAHASGPHPDVVDGALDPLDVALEEGLAEVWTHRNRSTIVQDVELDRIPGIDPHTTPTVVAYLAYGNAAVALVDHLAGLTERSADEITLELLGAAPAERWGLIADAALDKRLPGMPPAQRTELRAELVTQLREDYQPVVGLQEETNSPSRPVADIVADAKDAGHRTVARLAERIERAAKEPAGQVAEEVHQLRSAALDGNLPTYAPAAGGGSAAGQAAAQPTTEAARPSTAAPRRAQRQAQPDRPAR